MMHKAWSSIEELSYCFARSSVKFQGRTALKNRRIWPRLGASGLLLKFEFTSGYEMMHKALSSIEEVPYCFWGSSVKFLGYTANKIVDFDPNWAFPDCNSSLNSPMGTKWCTKVEVALKRCPIVLQGHPSNFTVTRVKKLTIWNQFEITRPVAAIKSLRFALFLSENIGRSKYIELSGEDFYCLDESLSGNEAILKCSRADIKINHGLPIQNWH